MTLVIKLFKFIYKHKLCCMFYEWQGAKYFSCQNSKARQQSIIKKVDENAIKQDVMKVMLNVVNEDGFRWDQKESAVQDAKTS